MPDLSDIDYEAISAYLDDELNPIDRAALETRLSTEPDLRTEMNALHQIRQAVAQLPTLTAPRDFRLTPAMLTARPASPPPVKLRPPQRSWLGSAAAAAAVVVAGGAVLFSSQLSGTTPPETVAQVASVPTHTSGRESVTPTVEAFLAAPLPAVAQPLPTMTPSTAEVPDGGTGAVSIKASSTSEPLLDEATTGAVANAEIMQEMVGSELEMTSESEFDTAEETNDTVAVPLAAMIATSPVADLAEGGVLRAPAARQQLESLALAWLTTLVDALRALLP